MLIQERPGCPAARRRLIATLAVLAAGLGVGAAPVCRAEVWFVGTGGDIGNPGTPALPFANIQQAVDAAADGDTVRIYDGVYAGPGNAGIAWSDKSLSLMSDSGDRDACVIQCGEDDGFTFLDTDLTDRHTLVFDGLSIVQADTAIAVLRYGSHYRTLVDVDVRRCSLRDGKVGAASIGGWLRLTDSEFIGNSGAGVTGAYAFDLTMNGCQSRDNGAGLFFAQFYGTVPVVLENSTFVANRNGIVSWQVIGGMALRNCRVDSSLTGHGIRAVTDNGWLSLDDCQVTGNARHGVANAQGTTLFAQRCLISANGYSGIAIPIADVALDLDDVRLTDNVGWGIGKYSTFDDNLKTDWDEVLKSADKDPNDDIRLRNCEVVGNLSGGVAVHGRFDPIRLSDCLIAGNGGPGLILNGVYPYSGSLLERVTIADNRGHGVQVVSGSCAATQTLVSHNDGAAFSQADGVTAQLTCCDLFGNAEGDWTAPLLLPQLGIEGNRWDDPLFCDRFGGDYGLREDSPLTAYNNGACGTIGRLDAACPAPPGALRVLVADVPDDQGFAVNLSWPRHARDDSVAVDQVLEYGVQRDQGGWCDLATVVAAAADSYSVVVPTTDVQVAGQPPTISRYRIVARTSRPGCTYASLPDSGGSVDNLPPPRPEVGLTDGLDYRVIYWSPPPIDDLASVCVYRGTESGFTPTEPHDCPGGYDFQETHLGRYFYRVQFTDAHGNVSEFSDELHGRYPTAVPVSTDRVLRLHPNHPNPFNPQTSISWDLPRSGRVRVSVYDLAGRRVRQLVDDELPAGSHEVVWDGRDASGQRVGSGNYLARLEFGGQGQTQVMGLVK